MSNAYGVYQNERYLIFTRFASTIISKAINDGGRFIWQLKNSPELIICWMCTTPDEIPRTVERELISMFRAANSGRRPFANLQN